MASKVMGEKIIIKSKKAIEVLEKLLISDFTKVKITEESRVNLEEHRKKASKILSKLF